MGESTAWLKASESHLETPAADRASLDLSFGPTHRNLVPDAWLSGVLEPLPTPHWISSLLDQRREEGIV